jgi:hypothetical protein
MAATIGIASYEFTRALPVTLRKVLPTIEAIEAELSAAAAKSAS